MSSNDDRYVTLPVGRGKLKVRYLTAGGAGQPVLLIHGFGGAAENWQPVIPALARRFRVYAIDLPGFGRSERPGPGFHITDLSQAAGAFIKAFGLTSLRVVGHSMGGAIAVEVTRTHPTTVDRLVLVDSAGLGPPPMSPPARVVLPFPSLGRLLIRLAASRFHYGRLLRGLVADGDQLSPAAKKSLRDSFLEMRLPPSKASDWVFGRFLDRVAQVSCPTLVLWGADDHLLPVEHGVTIFKHLQDGQLQVIEDCGHVMPFERPEELAAALLNFLSSTNGR